MKEPAEVEGRLWVDPDKVSEELACVDIHGLLRGDAVMQESAESLFKYMLSQGIDKNEALAIIGNSLIEIHNNPYAYAQHAALPLVVSGLEACAINPTCASMVAMGLTATYTALKMDAAPKLDNTLKTPIPDYESKDEGFTEHRGTATLEGFDIYDEWYVEEGFTIPEKIDTSILTKGEFSLDRTKALIKTLPDNVPSDREDYRFRFEEDLKNFLPETVKLHHGKLKEDLVLVNYHDKDKKLGFGKDDRTLSWGTPINIGNKLSTEEMLHQKLALVKPDWGKRDEVTLIRIPAGTDVTFISGRAKEQFSDKTGERFVGEGFQIRFRDFDEKWVKETKVLYKGK